MHKFKKGDRIIMNSKSVFSAGITGRFIEYNQYGSSTVRLDGNTQTSNFINNKVDSYNKIYLGGE